MCFFFFKQKTAYEIMPSLVGSEMCIRDRPNNSQAQDLFSNGTKKCNSTSIIYRVTSWVSLTKTPGCQLEPYGPEYPTLESVSYTHLRAHETRHDLVCRLLLEKKKK